MVVGRPANPFGKEFWIEELGGDGPRVAAYLRVSTKKQAREGLSLEVQKQKLDKMKEEFKPSVVYWFVDAGLSGEDFDKRKIKKILKLREGGEISQLWVTHVDRIGRECEDSLFFFLRFCKDGGLIRTPYRVYSSRDLADIVLYVVESYVAESENRRRAERANASKIQNFRNKRWNKPVPLGYCKNGAWLQKVNGYDPVIQDVFLLFLKRKSYSCVAREINNKYSAVLNKPLTRDVVKRVLADPVYAGHPSHMGETVVDENLRYVDDEVFNEVQTIIKGNESREKENRKNVQTLLASTYDVKLIDFLEQIAELRHRECGGILVKDGARFDGSLIQQAYKCNVCNAQFRVPTKRMLAADRSGGDSQSHVNSPKTPTEQPTDVKSQSEDHQPESNAEETKKCSETLPEHERSWDRRLQWVDSHIRDLTQKMIDEVIKLGNVEQRVRGCHLCFYKVAPSGKAAFAAFVLRKNSLNIRIRADGTFKDPEEWTGKKVYKSWFFKCQHVQEREFKIKSVEQIPYAIQLIKQSYNIDIAKTANKHDKGVDNGKTHHESISGSRYEISYWSGFQCSSTSYPSYARNYGVFATSTI